MRRGLAGLTNRGRAFLAAGITAVVCAVLLGQDSLTRVGVLLVALPLLAALLVGRGRYQLSLARSVSPQLVTAGQSAEVSLELTYQGRTSTGLLLLEDQVPFVLGTRPRFVVDALRHGVRRSVTYQVRSDVRGTFDIGPLSVRVNDPFGLVELGHAFQSTITMIVTPRTVVLPAIALGGAWTGSGDNRPRAFASGSAEDVSVREYNRGDDLRRVHWRSSARVGELMVRREERPWQSRATVFLDNRSSAHRGKGVASSLESAVSIAASIALHLGQRGFTVRLVTADGVYPNIAWHDRTSAQNTAPLLEALAVVESTDRTHLATDWIGGAAHSGLLVAVLGALDPHDQAVLRRMRLQGSNPMAIALEVDDWARTSSPSTPAGTATWLSAFGWRAVTGRPGDNLSTLWQDLGRRGSQAGPAVRESTLTRTPSTATPNGPAS